jgi:methylated-DNA-[protein]-cysteine S-methyltransferase
MMIGAVLDSPVGPLRIEADENVITTIFFHATEPVSRGRLPGVLAKLEAQLRLYFSGQLEAFDLPLAPKGTPFQQDVWQALTKIPYGETRSYAEIARKIGRPDAVRAVGAANGQNPIPIVLPCHRVIGSNGSLTGFGGGLAAKRFLLQLESKQKTLGIGDAIGD